MQVKCIPSDSLSQNFHHDDHNAVTVELLDKRYMHILFHTKKTVEGFGRDHKESGKAGNISVLMRITQTKRSEEGRMFPQFTGLRALDIIDRGWRSGW